jgi:NAD(P)H-hydrate epimerase
VIRLVACAEASRLDLATSSGAALPPLLLMEDASLRLWQAAQGIAKARGAGSTRLLLAVCGSGNNGGDALALLRHARFSGLLRVAAILTKAPGGLSAVHAASLEALGVELLSWTEDRPACERLLAEAAVIVDGVSGTGLSGPLRGSGASLVEAANAAARSGGAAIVSIDLPSGLSDSFEPGWPVAAASWTLSVEPRKACLYYPAARDSCGEIVPIEGVFPADAAVAPAARLLEAEDLLSLAPLPPDSAYKGSRGRVAVFAGSEGASGAAVLASRSCLAAGAGIAALYASPELYPIVAPMLDAVMVKKSGEGAADLSRYDALLVGPGWGRGEGRKAELARLLATGLPAVLDADAIYLYRALVDSGFRPSAPLVLTPHPGEFAALTGTGPEAALASPPARLAETARALRATIVLKSHVTWLASPEGELAVWDGRESGLGTAGSGDVLAGLAAGLVARFPALAFSAARAAVIAHGLAGRRARASLGWFESGALIGEAAKVLGLGVPDFP